MEDCKSISKLENAIREVFEEFRVKCNNTDKELHQKIVKLMKNSVMIILSEFESPRKEYFLKNALKAYEEAFTIQSQGLKIRNEQKESINKLNNNIKEVEKSAKKLIKKVEKLTDKQKLYKAILDGFDPGEDLAS